MKKTLIFLILLLVFGTLSARVKLDERIIRAELRKPGVKLVAIDFYMTGCPPCDAAIPMWKELKNQYGDALKLIVVAPTRSDGSCNVKGWNPDIIKCDDDAEIAGRWGVKDFPQAFLYSWHNNDPLVQLGSVKDVEKKISEYFRNIPRVLLEADQNSKNFVLLVEEALITNSKIEIVANDHESRHLAELREKSNDDQYDDNLKCELGKEISANSLLKIRNIGGNLVLKLLSAETSCIRAATTKHLSGDKKKLKTEIAAAVYDLLLQMFGHISMPQEERNTSFQTGRFGGKNEDWEIGAGAETIVKFESNPTGAVVMADGKLLCQSTPCSKTLTQGNHNIEMQMENYVPVSKKEEIKEGKAIKYTLEPDFAWLWVTGNRNVHLKLDGKNIGEIPIEGKQITPGNHKIEHSDRCFYDSGENFTIKRGEKKTIKFNLEPRESAIKVNAQDEKGNDVDADVFVDDKKVGRAPGTFKVLLCSNEMRVKKDGFAEYSEILELKEKKVAEFRPKLKKNIEEQLKKAIIVIESRTGSNEKLRIAVMEFEDQTEKLSKKILSDANEYIHSAFINSNKYIVVADAKNKVSIREKQKKMLQIFAKTILRPKIISFAGKYTVIFELIDLEKSAIMNGFKETFDGSEKSFSVAVKNIVAKFFDAGTNIAFDKKPIIAITDFNGMNNNLPKKTIENATEYMRNNIIGLNKYIVTPQDRETIIIKEYKKEYYIRAANSDYQTKIGVDLPAQTIFRTEITSFGGKHIITSIFIDPAKKVVVSGAKAIFDGSEKSLLLAIDNIAGLFEKNNYPTKSVDSDKLVISIKDFEDETGILSKKTLENAVEYIQNAFFGSNHYLVVPTGNANTIISKISQEIKKKSYNLAYDPNFQIPLAQDISTNNFLFTRISFSANRYLISSELIDTEQAVALKSANATFDGSEESLAKALDNIVEQITR